MVRKKEKKRETMTEKERLMKEKIERREADWIPKTELGRKVRNGEINSIQEAIDSKLPLLEPRITDLLLPDLQEKVIEFKKTAKVRRAGRQFSFRGSVLIGDGKEFVGMGTAKDKEKWPAIKKATNKAKLSLVRVRKGCGSWECTCGMPHSIPFQVKGKCASVRITLKPAPKGVGLVAGDNIKQVLEFVGIKDVWSETRGSTATKLNFVRATIDALSKTTGMKASEEMMKKARA